MVSPNQMVERATAKAKDVDALTSAAGGRLLPKDPATLSGFSEKVQSGTGSRIPLTYIKRPR